MINLTISTMMRSPFGNPFATSSNTISNMMPNPFATATSRSKKASKLFEAKMTVVKWKKDSLTNFKN